MHVKRPYALIPALLLLTSMRPAWAQTEDTFKLNAGYALQTDNNLFRLPASTLALGGNASATERISQSSVGLSFNKPYSLQRFEVDLNLIDSRYQQNSYLSFMAHNASAAWRWSLTPKLHGNLTSTRKETLNSFADNQTQNVRNQRTDTATRLDTIYELGAAWRVIGGVTAAAQNNVLPLAAEGSTSTTSGDVGLRYVWSSGTALSYAFKRINGKYTNRTLQPSTLLDNRFSQQDNELRLHWPLSGQTVVDINAAYISRTHPNFNQRDYSGINAGASLKWDISGKSALTASWVHELASYQTSSTNFTRTDRLSLSPVWQITPKTAIRLRYEIALRDYLDSPGSTPASQRSDTTHDASLSLEWQPYQNLGLTTSLQKARRTSNQPGFDYDSNMATIAAKYSF
ncbi:exopolysaccharide biosynthesis operon protein EpsL [Rhodoferax ferrireducens]|uniref:Exopolysaccharide biosynthesis operon protein EpsL n=1 Tax=Rhodoferax ferrireducens TaxID=192843 RepID=A0ABU2C6D8_9BURK|nr:XrtB/PEP-CTERM-associated polysaccharide biosynthesis outer membrane protein EpsL [Rhodoferax ferrireducens]MDR7376910.1 exopolysaccharide biosynthesis operon protein EpsL [Rhodoferax ferrireducens]